jgi:hypothetical protein
MLAIFNNLDFIGVTILLNKANSSLIIYPNTVLTLPVAG